MTDVSDPLAPTRARRWPFRRRATVLLLTAIVGLAGAGITLAIEAGSGAPPSLILSLSDKRPDPNVGISGGSFAQGTATFSMQMGSFQCSVRPVTVTSITLYRASSGIRLQRWGFANVLPTDAENIDHADVPLTEFIGGKGTSHTLTRRCTDPFDARLCLQLQRTAPGTQSWLGLRVTYTSAGRTKVAYLWEQYEIKDS